MNATLAEFAIDWQTAVSLLCVLAAVAWIARRYLWSRHSSCGTACGKCGGHAQEKLPIVDLGPSPEKQKTAGL